MPQVTAALNVVVNKAINELPHFMIHGNNKKLPYDIRSKDPNTIYNYDDYVHPRLIDFQEIDKRVKENMSALQEDIFN